jgi:hypothetical protein
MDFAAFTCTEGLDALRLRSSASEAVVSRQVV